jgi:hypothetical protein
MDYFKDYPCDQLNTQCMQQQGAITKTDCAISKALLTKAIAAENIA